MNKRFLAFIFCCTLIVGMFSGCTKKVDTSVESTTEVAVKDDEATTEAVVPTDEYATHYDITMSCWGIQDGYDSENAANDSILKDLEAKFNVTIKPVQVTWNDWKDKFKVWGASGELPDVFANDLATDDPTLYNQWATQGIIKALPEDLSKYTNISRIMALPSVTPLALDGRFYMVPRMTYDDVTEWRLDMMMMYRKDWAVEAGYTNQPKDFNEFLEMAKAVMKLHPGVTGLATNNPDFLTTIYYGSFPESKSWVNEDGRWIPGRISSRMNEPFKQLRTLYTEGILDQDFAIQKDATGTQKFYAGQAFAWFGNTLDGNKIADMFVPANPDVDPTAAFDYMMMWPAPDGKSYSHSALPYWSETFFNANLDAEKYDRILQLVDYMCSEEYQLKRLNGIEGVDYKVEDGKAVSLLTGDESLAKKYPVTANMGFLGAWAQGLPFGGKGIAPTDPLRNYYYQLRIDTFNQMKETHQPIPINFDIQLMESEAKNEVSSIMSKYQDDMVKIILGTDDPMKMFEDVVKSYNESGLQEAIDQVNVEIQEKGIK